jgi:uncharacterized protein with beta-barrel porin domain
MFRNTIRIIIQSIIYLSFILLPTKIFAYSTYGTVTYAPNNDYIYSTSCKTTPPKKYFGICGSSGPVVFAASASQGVQTDTPGYTMGLGGAGFLLEADAYGFLKLGVAISGFIMRVSGDEDAVNTGTRTKVVGGSPAVYGGLYYSGAFIYVTAATGVLKYTTSRTVRIPNLIADGHFEARQNSYRARIGYAAPFGTVEITPMATIDNVIISKGTYTETGAGAFNVTVRNGVSSASQAAAGVRVAEISEPEIFYPEIHFFATSDSNTTGNKLRVISRFLDGIPPVVLVGNTPGSNGYNVGGSITTTIFRTGTVMACYEYELRQKGFTGHSFFIRFMVAF